MIKENNFKLFLLLWAGQLTSAIGNGLTAFTLSVYSFQLTGTATSYSLIILCAFLPLVLLNPITGVLADRYDRRLLIIIADFGAILGLSYILLSLLSINIQIWQICLGVIISSSFTALHAPAYKATISDLLPPKKYAQASGLVQLASSAQYLISPLLAGVLLSLIDIQYILLIDIFSFVFAIMTTLMIRKMIPPFVPIKNKTHFYMEMIEGLKALTCDKRVFYLVILTALILFFIGWLQALFGPMVLVFSDAQTLGTVLSICAIGMLSSSLIIGISGIQYNPVIVLSISVALMGVFYAVIGTSTEIIFITLAGFLLFSTLPFINTSIEVLIRNNIDKTKQARVWSFISLITYTGSIMAYCSAGFLADHIFNPLFLYQNNSFINKLIGYGPGRGIGCMFVISGISIIFMSLFIRKQTHTLTIN